jgi:hypothetical protein
MDSTTNDSPQPIQYQYLNLWQAIVGAFWAFLLKDFADEVFKAQDINIQFPINLFKIMFVCALVIYMAWFSTSVSHFQSLREIKSNNTNWINVLRALAKLFWVMFIAYLFILVSFFILDTDISPFKMLLFGLLWPAWVVSFMFNHWISTIDHKQDNPET